MFAIDAKINLAEEALKAETALFFYGCPELT
jgi:hypothetical protein